MNGQVHGLNGKSLNALIDFDFIVDIDFGIIRFIRENYADKRAFKLDVLDKSDKEILSLLSTRDNWNPLSIISSEENMNDIDDLYNSFFEKYKEQIIHRSVAEVSITDFVSLAIEEGFNMGINVTISVSDDVEESEILSHFDRVNILKKSVQSSKDILMYDPIYVKDYRTFTKLGLENDIQNKKIYITPRKYNIDYFVKTENSLTRNNALALMGKKYDVPGEKENEQSEPVTSST